MDEILFPLLSFLFLNLLNKISPNEKKFCFIPITSLLGIFISIIIFKFF